jgi:hypothetical protein
MMGEKKMFTSYVKNRDSQDTIIFGDGNQGKVKGLGKIAITTEHSISNVFLVELLGYNLLSVSQLCQMGYNCLFTVGGLHLLKVLKNTTNMFSSIVYYHRKLRL